jgi:hypothetical protein
MRVHYKAATLALMTGLAGTAGLATAANPFPAGAPYGQPLYTPFPPQPQFQSPPPHMNPLPPQPQFRAPPPHMNPLPPQPQFRAPTAPPPVAPGTETGSPYAGYPHQAWRDRDDGPFDWGPWSDSDGDWGVNDWFGDWGSLFDGTGSLEMDFEMDMSMDFDADASADADTDTEFRGDSYYHGYEGYGPYGPGPYPLYPPAPVLAPTPAPYAPMPPGSLPPAVNPPSALPGAVSNP